MYRRAIEILTYLIGATVIVLGTVLLVAYGNGYSYDLRTGRLVYRGLVLLDSKPGNAVITVNGKVIKNKTPFRQSYERGSYSFTLSREGYREWRKTLEVVPSRVSLAQYVILIPQKIPVDTIAEFPRIQNFLASQDRRRIAFVVPTGPDAGVWAMEGQNRDRTKLYGLKPATPDQPAETAEILSWSEDSSRLLIKTISAGRNIFQVVSNDPGEPVINLTDTFRQEFGALAFSRTNWRELIWNSPEGLRRVDLAAQTISAVLTPKAANFVYAEDRIIYIDTSQPTASLWSVDRGGRKQQLVAALPPSGSYGLDYSTYINVPQVIVSSPDSQVTTLYSDVFGQMTSRTVKAPAGRPDFNGDGRFAVIHAETSLATYDLEYDRVYIFPEINSRVTGLSWFDNYHLQFTRGGQVVLAEFDGNYANVITRGDGQAPFNSPDNKTIYATSANSTGVSQIKAIKIRQ